ncbi:hypothetical protein V8C86DRAFT_2534432 [Haematococcus lacustris]
MLARNRQLLQLLWIATFMGRSLAQPWASSTGRELTQAAGSVGCTLRLWPAPAFHGAAYRYSTRFEWRQGSPAQCDRVPLGPVGMANRSHSLDLTCRCSALGSGGTCLELVRTAQLLLVAGSNPSSSALTALRLTIQAPGLCGTRTSCQWYSADLSRLVWAYAADGSALTADLVQQVASFSLCLGMPPMPSAYLGG